MTYVEFLLCFTYVLSVCCLQKEVKRDKKWGVIIVADGGRCERGGR